MGQRPDGKTDRNGVDFWWDNAAGARGNCWYRNTSPIGITTDPATLPDCSDGTDPGLSIGTGDGKNEGELGSCAGAFFTRNFDQPNPCPWLTPPSDPGDGDGAMGGGGSSTPVPPLTSFPTVRASAVPRQRDVPLGQTTCQDWNAAQSGADRAVLIGKVRLFVGGDINDATTQVGHGQRMSNEEMSTLYDNWCGYQWGQSFLLYKLYAFSAGFRYHAGAALTG
jgi:hypothetical protein